MDVVRAAFEFSAAHNVPVCGFLGEECVTHAMHPELEELHHRCGWSEEGRSVRSSAMEWEECVAHRRHVLRQRSCTQHR